MKFVADTRTLLIALWLGAALFFSFAVAPGVFAVLPSRELAGAVVNRTLAIINYSGLIIGLILLLSSFLFSGKSLSDWAEKVLSAILAIACGIGQFVIGARLHALREQIARPIDEVSIDDPLRIAFNNLHTYSVWVLMTAMLAALAAYFLIRRKGSGAKQFQ